ncbi:MAG: RIP metalloprotease RseP [Pseudomonadales bacterium]|nr:RIP metalloprotease RseP [Pseudomonadales bacterium]
MIINILAMLLTLGILVTVHEFGHFWVARRCGVKVERFSIGFGKPLLKWTRQGTEYVIALLPLGGYVKMLGEQDVAIPESERHLAFNHKPLSQRAAIVAAGPLANFLLAIFLYWLMFMVGVSGVAPVVGTVKNDSPAALAGLQAGDEIVAVDGESTRTWQEVQVQLLGRLGESGFLNLTATSPERAKPLVARINLERWLNNDAEPDPLQALGITPFRLDIPPRLGEIVAGGRAESAGLLPGDLVLAVNGDKLGGWLEWIDIVRANPESDLQLVVERGGERINLELRPALTMAEDGSERGFIGAGVSTPEVMPTLPPEMNREIRYSAWQALPQALSETWNNTVFVLDSIKKMILGLISVENLSGPITIAQIAGQTATYGFEYYIGFLAVLSISLGVLNLLPIPVLDGGHLFYYLVETIIRRPVPEKVQAMGMQIGITLIVGIMLIAFYNDVNRLF